MAKEPTSTEQFRNQPTRLINRRDLDTRNRGLAVILKILESDTIALLSSTGVDLGTGDVKLALKPTGVRPGRYNTFDVDKYGRIVNAQLVEQGGSAIDPTQVIRNQSSSAQNASFWISGSGTVGSLTVNNPISIASGGTGVAEVAQGLVFIGPVSGVGAPSWRTLSASDIPVIPWVKISNTPTTRDGYGLVDVYTRAEADALFGGSHYTLPVATPSVLGGVKIGEGVSATPDGTLSVAAVRRRQTFTVGNGIDRVFNCLHDFGTAGVIVSVRSTTGTREQELHDNYLTPGNELNSVTVSFPAQAPAPAAGAYQVTIIADNSVLMSEDVIDAKSRLVAVQMPATDDNVPLLYTQNNVSGVVVRAVLAGDPGSSVTFDLYQAAARSAGDAGTPMLASTQTLTNTTTGSELLLETTALSAGTFVYAIVRSAAVARTLEFYVSYIEETNP